MDPWFQVMGSPTRKSGIEYTLKKLLQLTTNEEAFDALKTKTVDLVLTAHSTQFVPNVLKICRTLPSPWYFNSCDFVLLMCFVRLLSGFVMVWHSYMRKTLLLLMNKNSMKICNIKIQVAFRTDEIQRTPPAQQDEMRAALSYYHETTWKWVLKFLKRVPTALKNIGIN